MRGRWIALLPLALLVEHAGATDLYSPGSWPSLASDRIASAPGDILTILVYEQASASNSIGTTSSKENRIGGDIRAGDALDESGSLGFGGNSDSKGSTSRSGRMVAQISATVDTVLANGDLQVSGTQLMLINGERTTLRVRGRARRVDITAYNALLSSRLADAQIDYDGKGFVTRSGTPGIVTRLFNWLGVL